MSEVRSGISEIPDGLAERVERAVFDAWAVRNGAEPTADSSWWHIHRSGPTHTKWAADAALAVVADAVRQAVHQAVDAAVDEALAEVERRIEAEAARIVVHPHEFHRIGRKDGLRQASNILSDLKTGPRRDSDSSEVRPPESAIEKVLLEAEWRAMPRLVHGVLTGNRRNRARQQGYHDGRRDAAHAVAALRSERREAGRDCRHVFPDGTRCTLTSHDVPGLAELHGVQEARRDR